MSTVRQSRDSREKAKKAMRLGTKSCVECRRRKVRCIFLPENPQTCQQCVLHESICQPQGAATVSNPSGRYPLTPASDRTVTSGSGYLLDDLSSSVSHVSFDRQQGGGQGRVASDLASQAGGYHENNQRLLLDCAPLISHLRASQLIPTSSQGGGGAGSLSRSVISNSLGALIPQSSTLNTIFRFTQPFWSIWPLASDPESGPDADSHLFPTNVTEAHCFLNNHVYNTSERAKVAKGITWLSLCIQQLPAEMLQPGKLEPPLPLPAPDLVSRLLREAQTLIKESFDSDGDDGHMESIETSVVQYKCFVNMGQPRQAWKAIRGAIDCALLSGYYRSSSSSSTTDRKKRQLWISLWNQDRQMALVLGLPYSIPDSLANLQQGGGHEDASPPIPPPLHVQILGQLCSIGGRIIDRDQAGGAEAPYSLTAQRAEDMEKLESLIPHEWASSHPGSDFLSAPTGLFFWRRGAVFFFHYTNHLLHLPFLWKGKTESRFAHSRQMALSSAEGMLSTFMLFPNPRDGVPVVCDFLDFAAFSGALALATDLIRRSSDEHHQQEGKQQQQQQDEEESRLWALIMQFSVCMRRKADVLGSAVATQSATVLEYLHAARHGIYKGPEDYVVVIPFFGKICIRRPVAAAVQNATQSPSARSLEQLRGTFSPFDPCGSNNNNNNNNNLATTTTIEFNTKLCGCRAPSGVNTTTSLELGADWETDVCMMDNDVASSWDWTGMFDYEGMWTSAG